MFSFSLILPSAFTSHSLICSCETHGRQRVSRRLCITVLCQSSLIRSRMHLAFPLSHCREKSIVALTRTMTATVSDCDTKKSPQYEASEFTSLRVYSLLDRYRVSARHPSFIHDVTRQHAANMPSSAKISHSLFLFFVSRVVLFFFCYCLGCLPDLASPQRAAQCCSRGLVLLATDLFMFLTPLFCSEWCSLMCFSLTRVLRSSRV